MAATLFPRADTIPIHNNSILLRQLGVSEATNRYDIGTNINFFDGTFYHGKIASDNEKWYKIRYNNGNEEELTHKQTTLIIKYNQILFTASFGLALSSILLDTEKKSNIAFKGFSMIQDISSSVTYLVKVKEIEWEELVSDPLTSANWNHSTSNKLDQMAQGVGKNADDIQQTKGTVIIFFIPSYKVRKVRKDRKVTYIQKVCTYRLDKSELNQTRFTTMGNFITDYTGKIRHKTAGLEVIKMHWNSVLSMKS